MAVGRHARPRIRLTNTAAATAKGINVSALRPHVARCACGCNPTLLVFGDHPRFTDPAASEALVAANQHLQRVTIDHAGDLPQLEQPDETAAVVEGFLG
ncbi:MAG TPA: alpha/beta hydrolase [Candidatus Limnocylindrales bacterium]